MLDVVVLISGSGSNLRALVDAATDSDYPARIVAVGSDTEPAGFAHAHEFGIPTFSVFLDSFTSRDAWADELRTQTLAWSPDLIVCAGFMRILPSSFVRSFSPRLINLHPALLPQFPGAHAVRDALNSGVATTGSTVHIVDDGVDTGPVIRQRAVDILPGDDEATLHARIKQVEQPLLVETVADIARGRINLKELSTA